MNSLLDFFSWYVIVSLLGLLTFPLAYRLFPALADRGYSLSRAAGLLIWGYVFWLCTSLGLTQNTVGGILFGLLVLIALSAVILSKLSGRSTSLTEILKWMRVHLGLVLTVEVLFLAAFAFLAFLRAGNPELDNAEKPMELMFINAILHSPTFPPHDSWLSGYAISYYYFGYVMAAMLAKLTGLTGSVAHNLMTALIFGLAAIGSYGILYNLLAARDEAAPEEETPDPNKNEPNSRAGLFAFLGPLFLLLVSNLEGFLEVLHLRGIFWPVNSTSNFWTWLGIKELSDPPAALPGDLGPRLTYWWTQQGWMGIGTWFNEQFAPGWFWWWWRASRVISDYDLKGNFQEVIDEFPFFSFLHADLHPHVLAIPFNLLAIAIALNIFRGGWRGEMNLFGYRLQISLTGFLAAAITLGGLAFLNTWDILVGAALIVGAYVLFCIRQAGWSWARLLDLLGFGLPLGLLAVLFYLPFYLGFSSQAGGVYPNLVNPTHGAQLWVMFAPLLIPLFAYLLYLTFRVNVKGNWILGLLLVVGAVIFLWTASWTLAWLILLRDPAVGGQYLASQGLTDVGVLFNMALSRRLVAMGGLLTLILLLIPAAAFFFVHQRSVDDLANENAGTGGSQPSGQTSSIFVMLLILLAGLLVIAPEFVYLRDEFLTRMNTIFKFYYQAWLLWSLAAAFGTAVLLQKLRGTPDLIFRLGMVLLLFMSLTYPALAIANKTNNFAPGLGWTLDDFVRIQRGSPDEAAAIQWLNSAPDGVLAEAVGGSYTSFARISTYTGLPAVLGWPGHEAQWRGSNDPQGTRQNDIAALYSTPNWQTALTIIKEYNIRYIYIGGLERSAYPVQEKKFQDNLVQVFQQGNVTIYEVP